MHAFRKISIVARFEIKTLLRSWFFRIFAGLSLVILVFFDLATITNVFGDAAWYFGISGNRIPEKGS